VFNVARFRSLIVPLTAAWLSLHLVVMTGAAVVAFTAGGSVSDIVCTCTHGADHAACPMHGTPKDSTRCRLQSTQDDLGTALMSVLGPLMLPAASHVVTVDAPSFRTIGFGSPFPSNWIVPPDPPPPRS